MSRHAFAFLPLLALLATPTHAQFAVDPDWLAVLQPGSPVLAAHPDIRHFRRGMQLLDEDRPDQALHAFRRAARYASKGAQAMIADLHWRGVVEGADRAEAYAWMDLAAERGYLRFAIERERIWEALTPTERERALQRGAELYAEYGDDVAKPRMTGELMRARMRITGSRTGADTGVSASAARFQGADPRNALTLSQASNVGVHDNPYDRKFWDVEEYWAFQHEVWDGRAIRPEVEVKAVRPSRDEGTR